MPIEIAASPIEVLWDSPDDDRRQEADLQVRGAELLDRARQFVELPPWRPDALDEAMHDLTNLAERAVAAMFERMQRECHRLSPQECLQAAALALELQRLVQDHQRWQAGRRLRAVTQVQDILSRRDVDLAAALGHAAAETCRVLGFDRAMIFRRAGNMLTAEATYFVGQQEWARHCQEHAEQNPIRLSRRQTESEMLTRRAAALVTDPQHDPNTWKPIVQKIRTPGYVATPIAVRGEIVATLHADNEISGRPIGRSERDALAAFGSGLGFAIERAVLVDRLASQRETMRRMVAAAENTVEDFLRAESAWRRPGPSTPPAPAPLRASVPATLTARERQVLQLMAGGASNADIAARLVITPATVKTHVKHVLRKLDATSRAQAVAIFLAGT